MFSCPVLNWKYLLDDHVRFFCGGMNCMLIKKTKFVHFLPWCVASETEVKKSQFKVINVSETSNISVMHYNYK